MKICLLGDASSIHLKRWCEYFKECGDEVSVITFNPSIIEGVKVYNLGSNINIMTNGGNIQYLKKIYSVKRLLKDIKPDIVNAHYLTSYGLIGTLSSKVPLVVSTWGSDILVTPKKNLIYKKMAQYIIKKSNLLTSDSHFMTEEIIKLGGIKEKIITVPMGIDPSVFNMNNCNNLHTNKKIISMRTLCSNSNIDVILRAFNKIVKENNSVSLYITNSGDKEKELIELSKELNISDKVKFLGIVNRNEVVKLLKEGSIYVSIPTSDSTSVTLLEAMACGIFPIVSDIPANNEWIKDGYNGCIIKHINDSLLYNALKKSLYDNEKIQKSGIINDKIIKDRALWNDNMNYIRQEYLRLINKR